MRIVLDLQACQNAGNSLRGIGRYSMALAKAMAACASSHELILALDGGDDTSLDAITADFDGLVPRERIVSWLAPSPTAEAVPANQWRTRAAELVREHFLAVLEPDIVHVASLFEGLHDNGATSIGLLPNGPPSVVTLYDLIPAIQPETYLPFPEAREWYRRKLVSLKRADLCLAISEHTRKEAVGLLGMSPDRIVTILAAADPIFRPIQVPDAREVRQRLGISRRMVMYTGGFDQRKNLERLVEAFAALPVPIRLSHQLVIVGAVTEYQRANLEAVGKRAGLRNGDIVFPGFVSDDDLIKLYCLCDVFVMPSLHEGFGLPVLEAMKCGAPVVCSNTTSLPEVIGLKDAVFDPHSVKEITGAIHRTLTDEGFKDTLKRHGLSRSKNFSWEECARRTLEAFEELHARKAGPKGDVQVKAARPHLAFVSSFPAASEGSQADSHAALVLSELAAYYEIDLIALNNGTAAPIPDTGVRSRTVEWFIENGNIFDRVVYHLGASPADAPVLDLIDRWPGTVILHDFHLGPLWRHMEEVRGVAEAWKGELYRSHGYGALMAKTKVPPHAPCDADLPCNGTIVERAEGIVVHSRRALRLGAEWHGTAAAARWRKGIVARKPSFPMDRGTARRVLGFRDEDFVICAFGDARSEGFGNRLPGALAASSLLDDPTCRIVITDGSGGTSELPGTAKGSVERMRPHLYGTYLSAADVAVQLTDASSGRSLEQILDCMAHGLPTILVGEGTALDIPPATAVFLGPTSGGDLAAALEKLRTDPELRNRIGSAASSHVREHHTPARAAASYHDAIELFHETSQVARLERLARGIVAIEATTSPSDTDIRQVIGCVAANRRRERDGRQLLLDISELVQRDARTGIQRVVRALLTNLMAAAPKGFRVEPVFFDVSHRMHYARRFGGRFCGMALETLQDTIVDLYPGDVFVGLDLQIDPVLGRTEIHRQMRARGVQIHYVIYDLLPALHPEWFVGDVRMLPWLETICSVSDGIVCISRTVGRELEDWLPKLAIRRDRPLRIGHFHLGDDLDGYEAGHDSDEELPFPPGEPSFLMVGTVEIRKGHEQVLAAFERLWADGVDAHLVIVGKHGWKVERLVDRIRKHPELGRRLHWYEKASDNLLLRLYRECWALLAASRGEGFGLPLIEAAKYAQPIIARDLPVFQEIAGDHATYFSGDDAAGLAGTIRQWLTAKQAGTIPSTADMPRLTWKQSTQVLVDVLLGGRWDTVWKPGELPARPAGNILRSAVSGKSAGAPEQEPVAG